jgi:hypothetical protein
VRGWCGRAGFASGPQGVARMARRGFTRTRLAWALGRGVGGLARRLGVLAFSGSGSGGAPVVGAARGRRATGKSKGRREKEGWSRGVPHGCERVGGGRQKGGGGQQGRGRARRLG